MKYIVNILSNVNEPKFRSINASNQSFVEKIINVNGATQLMLNIGFEIEFENVNQGKQSIFLNPVTTLPKQKSISKLIMHEIFALENSQFLQNIFRLLNQTCDELNIPSSERPILKPVVKIDVSKEDRKIEFDPFKSVITRNVPQPRGPSISTTEIKLKELEKRKQELEGPINPNIRNTEVKIQLSCSTLTYLILSYSYNNNVFLSIIS